MKKKVITATLITASIMGAFFIGKSQAKTEMSYILSLMMEMNMYSQNKKGENTMYIIAITPIETYTADATTMTLYNSQGKPVTKGFLRIMAAMWSKNIVALERINYNGNVLGSWCSKKCGMFA